MRKREVGGDGSGRWEEGDGRRRWREVEGGREGYVLDGLEGILTSY